MKNFVLQTINILIVGCLGLTISSARVGIKPTTSTAVAPETTTPTEASNEEESAAPLYNIDCQRSSNVNGAFNFKDCRIVKIRGDDSLQAVKPYQHVGNISFDGVSPDENGQAKDITQNGTLNIAPFGTIYSNSASPNGTAVTS